jgi:hypothetical protein
MSRGGARKGAGRKPEYGAPMQVRLSILLPQELAQQLDAEVRRSGLDTSTIVRWCLEHSLSESQKVPPYQPW